MPEINEQGAAKLPSNGDETVDNQASPSRQIDQSTHQSRPSNVYSSPPPPIPKDWSPATPIPKDWSPATPIPKERLLQRKGVNYFF